MNDLVWMFWNRRLSKLLSGSENCSILYNMSFSGEKCTISVKGTWGCGKGQLYSDEWCGHLRHALWRQYVVCLSKVSLFLSPWECPRLSSNNCLKPPNVASTPEERQPITEGPVRGLRGSDFRSRRPGFKSCFYPWLLVWLWVSHLTPLCLFYHL